MSLAKAFLWPGTKVCELLGVDPEGDAVLIRWAVNTMFYVTVGLIVVWLVLA